MATSNTAPKQGTVVPNRIFVGGIPSSASEAELHNLFSKYGNVKAAKIIVDRSGISKGYGFITFEKDEEAELVLKECDIPVLRERKLNVARAVKKALPSHQIAVGSLHGATAGRMLHAAQYPVLVQQPMYMPQYYAQVLGGGYHQNFYDSHDMLQYSNVGNDYSESDVSSESSKSMAKSSTASSYEYESSGANSPVPKACHQLSTYRLATNAIHSPSMHHAQAYQLHQVMPKAGMAIMAYPSSIVMSTPTIVHMKDNGNEQENAVSEFSFLPSSMQSPISSAPLTPPPTPWSPIPCDFGSNFDSAHKN